MMDPKRVTIFDWAPISPDNGVVLITKKAPAVKGRRTSTKDAFLCKVPGGYSALRQGTVWRGSQRLVRHSANIPKTSERKPSPRPSLGASCAPIYKRSKNGLLITGIQTRTGMICLSKTSYAEVDIQNFFCGCTLYNWRRRKTCSMKKKNLFGIQLVHPIVDWQPLIIKVISEVKHCKIIYKK